MNTPTAALGRSIAAILLMCLGGCGGEERSSLNPVAPTPPVVTSPPAANPNRWSISGRVVTTVTGEPVANATLDLQGFGAVPVGSDGTFRFEATTLPPFSPYQLTVSAPGYVTRTARVLWQRGDRIDVTIDVIRDALPFSLTFYRQLVRNAAEGPLEPLRRLTSPPKVYVRTVDNTTGRAVEPEVLALVLDNLRKAVPLWSSNAWTLSVLETGTEQRPRMSGWIIVEFIRTNDNYCGMAGIGQSAGHITLNNDRCHCGSVKIQPSTVIHEVGHAMGFWHVTDRDSIMANQNSGSCFPATLSALERTLAAIAYQRPVGSRDIDTDPETPGFARVTPVEMVH